MKELSLNILDITENSVKAEASLITIEIEESAETLTFTVTDNGYGMKTETLAAVTDPFYTTRTTRRVGMGIPLLMLAAQQTGGEVTVTSRHLDDAPEDHGTRVRARFYKNHIDYTPLGDVISTLVTLIQGHPTVDFLFRHAMEDGSEVTLDTRELRAVLEDVPLDNYEVLTWIRENLSEQYNNG